MEPWSWEEADRFQRYIRHPSQEQLVDCRYQLGRENLKDVLSELPTRATRLLVMLLPSTLRKAQRMGKIGEGLKNLDLAIMFEILTSYLGRC